VKQICSQSPSDDESENNNEDYDMVDMLDKRNSMDQDTIMKLITDQMLNIKKEFAEK
jgi:hypothetical protein